MRFPFNGLCFSTPHFIPLHFVCSVSGFIEAPHLPISLSLRRHLNILFLLSNTLSSFVASGSLCYIHSFGVLLNSFGCHFRHE